MKAPRKTSLRSIARALGVSLSALQTARDSGRVTITDPPNIDALRAQWVASTNAQGPAPLAARGAPAPVEAESLASSKARKEAALADLRELELARERGELVPVKDVRRAWVDHITAARSRLLALPTRLRGEVPEMGTKGFEVATQVVRDVLTELANEGEQSED